MAVFVLLNTGVCTRFFPYKNCIAGCTISRADNPCWYIARLQRLGENDMVVIIKSEALKARNIPAQAFGLGFWKTIRKKLALKGWDDND
jgi:hypothetical protein